MHFLRSPLTWTLLLLGIWLNCESNHRTMQAYGVDAVSYGDVFGQALIGSVAVVAIVVIVALLRGERLESDQGEGPGQVVIGAVLICGILLIGMIAIPELLNAINPPTQGEQVYAPVTFDNGKGLR